MHLPLASLLLLLITALPAAAAPVDFSHQIVPILREHCSECHTGNKKKGGLSMNDRASFLAGSENGPIVEPGNAAKSRLIEVLHPPDPDDQMPPKGGPLPPEKIALLRAWVDEGLTWEEGFAFQKPAYEPPLRPRHVDLPPATDGRDHPIDRLVDHYLAKNNIARPATLDDAAFLRRASLDLNGLLPEPAAFLAFIADPAPDKRARLIRSLLGSDVAYTEHWLTFWNDLLRNDYDGTGFITGGRKQITQWLYAALLQNKPYDQFARELIAPTPESAGFSEGIKWRGTVSAGQTTEIQFAQSTSQSFLGINMKCASCHDSFIDRWKLSEAYGLAAVVSEKPLELFRCDKATGKIQGAAWLFPELGDIDPAKPVHERQQQMAALMTHPENGRFTRTLVNRLWHQLLGRGIIYPVDAMSTPPWDADLLDWLAVEFAAQKYDLKKMLEVICLSQAYQSKSQTLSQTTDAAGYHYAGPRAKRLTAEQYVDALWQLTGAAPQKPDARVVRMKTSTAAATGGPVPATTATWIWGSSAAPGNTPPANETIKLRYTFESAADHPTLGAVISCDNEFTLLVNGKEVSRSADWMQPQTLLLPKLIKKGKNEILVTAKNGGDGPNPAGFFFQGLIQPTEGSAIPIVSNAAWEWSTMIPLEWKPAVIVPTVPAWAEKIDQSATGLLTAAFESGSQMVRASLLKSDFLMRTLGRPNRDQIVSLRPNDLSTLEAIDLSNGSILAGYLSKGAEALLARPWKNPDELTAWIYQFALSRNPTPAELSTVRDLMPNGPDATSLQDLLWAVCMLPEFQLNR